MQQRVHDRSLFSSLPHMHVATNEALGVTSFKRIIDTQTSKRGEANNLCRHPRGLTDYARVQENWNRVCVLLVFLVPATGDAQIFGIELSPPDSCSAGKYQYDRDTLFIAWPCLAL